MNEGPTQRHVACPACGLLAPPEGNFCESCGTALTAPAPAPDADASSAPPQEERRRSRRRRQAPEPKTPLDRAEKIEIGRTLATARRHLKSIRLFLWFVAAGYAVFGLLLWNLRDPEFAEEIRLLSYVMFGVSALGVVAALSLHRQPFVWTMGLASLQTLVLVLSFVKGGLPLLQIVITVGLWGCVPLMARVSRILREHGDEYGSEHLLRRVGRDVGTSDVRQRAADRRRQERRRKLRTTGVVAAVSIVVLAAGYGLFRLATASATLENRLEAFEDSFETGAFEQVRAMCTLDYARRTWPDIERIIEREGWGERAPDLGAPEIQHRFDEFAEVHFTLPAGRMRTKWVRQNATWQLDGVIFAGLRERR